MMSEAAGEARKMIAPGDVHRRRRSGAGPRCAPRRPRGTSGRRAPAAVPGVAMNVGATALTVMLCLPHSTARHLVRWAIAGLGHAVNRLARQRHRAGLGAEVDDAPVPLADHHAPRGLAHEEGALEVDGHGEVEVLFAHDLGGVLRSEARVVHQDVELAQARHDLVDRARDLVEAGDVHLQRRTRGAPSARARRRASTSTVAHAERRCPRPRSRAPVRSPRPRPPVRAR